MSNGSRGRLLIVGLALGLLLGVVAGIWAARFWDVLFPPATPAPPVAARSPSAVPWPSVEAPSPENAAETSPVEAEAPAEAEGATGATPGKPARPASAPRAPKGRQKAGAPAGGPSGAGEVPRALGPTRPRSFVPGLTRVGNLRPIEADLKGFDASGVEVKRASRTIGRIEFEVLPPDVRPGQPYTVKVYLRNEGKRPIKVRKLTIASELNGRSSRSEVSPRLREVAPDLAALLAEVPGIWKEGVSSWSLDVEVTAEHDDTLGNALSWK